MLAEADIYSYDKGMLHNCCFVNFYGVWFREVVLECQSLERMILNLS